MTMDFEISVSVLGESPSISPTPQNPQVIIPGREQAKLFRSYMTTNEQRQRSGQGLLLCCRL
jgi:hypothetical protein